MHMLQDRETLYILGEEQRGSQLACRQGELPGKKWSRSPFCGTPNHETTNAGKMESFSYELLQAAEIHAFMRYFGR